MIPLSFPRCFDSRIAGPDGGEEPSGGNVLHLIQIRLVTPSLQKISPACQDNLPHARIAVSSSTKALNFSSACTTKRLPSSRCASAIQIVRPLESIAETQPQLQRALLRLSEIISQLHLMPSVAPFRRTAQVELYGFFGAGDAASF
jgi:hypothetical protein